MRVAPLAAVLALLLLAPSVARAQACSVSVDRALAFGNYLPTSSAPRDTNANIVVSCNATVGLLISYAVRLQSASSGVMSGPKGTLSYMLASDALFTSLWSNDRSVGGTILLTALSLFGTRQHAIYARLPPGQMVGPGTYSDSLMIVLTY